MKNKFTLSGFFMFLAFFGYSQIEKNHNSVSEQNQKPSYEISTDAISENPISLLEESETIVLANFKSGSSLPIFNFQKEDLKQLIAFINAGDNYVYQLIGHTNSQGSEDSNLSLSRLRANRLNELLVKEFELDPSRLKIVGEGEGSPIETNETTSGRAQNSRVELAKY